MFRITATSLALLFPLLAVPVQAQTSDTDWDRITAGMDAFMEQAEARRPQCADRCAGNPGLWILHRVDDESLYGPARSPA